jgi:hypothetical protein
MGHAAHLARRDAGHRRRGDDLERAGLSGRELPVNGTKAGEFAASDAPPADVCP